MPACSARTSVEGRNGQDRSANEPCRRPCLAMTARIHRAGTPIWWPVTLCLRRVVLPHRTQLGPATQAGPWRYPRQIDPLFAVKFPVAITLLTRRWNSVFRDLGKMNADLHDTDADQSIVLYFRARQSPQLHVRMSTHRRAKHDGGSSATALA